MAEPDLRTDKDRAPDSTHHVDPGAPAAPAWDGAAAAAQSAELSGAAKGVQAGPLVSPTADLEAFDAANQARDAAIAEARLRRLEAIEEVRTLLGQYRLAADAWEARASAFGLAYLGAYRLHVGALEAQGRAAHVPIEVCTNALGLGVAAGIGILGGWAVGGASVAGYKWFVDGLSPVLLQTFGVALTAGPPPAIAFAPDPTLFHLSLTQAVRDHAVHQVGAVAEFLEVVRAEPLVPPGPSVSLLIGGIQAAREHVAFLQPRPSESVEDLAQRMERALWAAWLPRLLRVQAPQVVSAGCLEPAHVTRGGVHVERPGEHIEVRLRALGVPLASVPTPHDLTMMIDWALRHQAPAFGSGGVS